MVLFQIKPPYISFLNNSIIEYDFITFSFIPYLVTTFQQSVVGEINRFPELTVEEVQKAVKYIPFHYKCFLVVSSGLKIRFLQNGIIRKL